MSANVCWAPANPNPGVLSTPAPQGFIKMLEEAGFELPMTFGQTDIPVLVGMVAAAGSVSYSKPLAELLAAVRQHGDVQVWVQQ